VARLLRRTQRRFARRRKPGIRRTPNIAKNTTASTERSCSNTDASIVRRRKHQRNNLHRKPDIYSHEFHFPFRRRRVLRPVFDLVVREFSNVLAVSAVQSVEISFCKSRMPRKIRPGNRPRIPIKTGYSLGVLNRKCCLSILGCCGCLSR